MGKKKEKKKINKPSEKFKFNFEWGLQEDTSRDLNPLYDKPNEAHLLFGRGLRAGVDRRVQKKEGTGHQLALISKSREDHGDRITREERRAAEDKERKEEEAEPPYPSPLILST